MRLVRNKRKKLPRARLPARMGILCGRRALRAFRLPFRGLARIGRGDFLGLVCGYVRACVEVRSGNDGADGHALITRRQVPFTTKLADALVHSAQSRKR